jgi:hypothetical protein
MVPVSVSFLYAPGAGEQLGHQRWDAFRVATSWCAPASSSAEYDFIFRQPAADHLQKRFRNMKAADQREA